MSALIDFLESHRVDYRLSGDSHVTENWVGCQCPMCNSRSFHLGFHLESGRASCWKCGKVNAVQVLAELCGIPKSEAFRFLKSLSPSFESTKTQHTGKLQIPSGVGPLLLSHKAYLRSRGFDPDTIVKLWGVQGIGLHPTLAHRLWIPITDQHNRTVSWTTRSISPKAARRYWSASADQEAQNHKTLLYGAAMARNVCICVEGPLDAWTIGPGACATFGQSITQAQVLLIGKYLRRVILFDAVPDAQDRAKALCQQLAVLPGETMNVQLDSGKDANAADPREIESLRREFFGI